MEPHQMEPTQMEPDGTVPCPQIELPCHRNTGWPISQVSHLCYELSPPELLTPKPHPENTTRHVMKACQPALTTHELLSAHSSYPLPGAGSGRKAKVSDTFLPYIKNACWYNLIINLCFLPTTFSTNIFSLLMKPCIHLLQCNTANTISVP